MNGRVLSPVDTSTAASRAEYPHRNQFDPLVLLGIINELWGKHLPPY